MKVVDSVLCKVDTYFVITPDTASGKNFARGPYFQQEAAQKAAVEVLGAGFRDAYVAVIASHLRTATQVVEVVNGQ